VDARGLMPSYEMSRVTLRSPDVQIGTERRSCYSQPLHLSKQRIGTKIETGSRQCSNGNVAGYKYGKLEAIKKVS